MSYRNTISLEMTFTRYRQTFCYNHLQIAEHFLEGKTLQFDMGKAELLKYRRHIASYLLSKTGWNLNNSHDILEYYVYFLHYVSFTNFLQLSK